MISKVMYNLLRTNELLGFCNEIKFHLKSLNLEGLQLDTPIENFIQKYDTALKVANRAKSSQYTAELREKDIRRDESFIAFRNYMEACTHRKEDEIRDAANTICQIIRTHGWTLYNDGTKVQSAKMASLCKELEKNKQVISTLSAADWYKNMQEDNEAYNQLKMDKLKAESNQTVYDTIAVYKELRIACEELLESIKVLNRIQPNEKYVELANFINTCTQRYMTIARSRKTKSENANSDIQEQ